MYTTFCKRGNHAKTPVHGNALLPSFLRVIVDSRIIDCDGVYEACPHLSCGRDNASLHIGQRKYRSLDTGFGVELAPYNAVTASK